MIEFFAQNTVLDGQGIIGMPNTYVKKAERERKAQTDTIVETLLGICTDPHAPPETKLGAVKTLKPIQDLEHQVAIKDQQISQKDEEIRQLKSQVETKNTELEAVGKEWEAALEQSRSYAEKIESLERDNKKLADEHTECSTQLTTTQAERDAAVERAEQAEADVEKLTASLQILADEFVPPQERHSTASRQFRTHGLNLSTHWYTVLDLQGALRYEDEMKQLEKLIAEAKKQQRPLRSMVTYLKSDAETFRDLFLYELVLHRGEWLEKSLVNFFQAQKADYSKWHTWCNGETSATDDNEEYESFCEGRLAYNQAVKLGCYLTFPAPKPASAD